MKNLSGKLVLITGGTSGIGKATAKFLAEKGLIVYATGRDISKAKDLENIGVNLEYLDLLDEKSMEKVISKILSKHNTIDFLINNAGYGIAGAIEDIPIEEAIKQIEVNVFGQIKLCKMVIPIMRNHKSGRIINITSIASLIPSPFLSWYSTSKVAFSFLTFALRQEVKQFGIDVVELAPAGINTNWPIIAKENLEKFSKNSIYKPMAEKMFKFFDESIKSSPSPDIVAKKIYKILQKKKTKPRYYVPFYAKFVKLASVLPLTSIEKFYQTFFK